MNDKVDVAEYLKSHSGEEFKTLFDTAVSVWNLKLSVQPTGDSAVENVKVAQKFIAEELSQMNAAERVAFIESDVKAHFGLSDDATSKLVKTHANVDAENATLIVELARGMATFFHTPEDQEFAAINLQTGGVAVYPINSRKFKQELSRRYFEVTSKPPSRDHMTAAMDILCAYANFQGAEIELHNRVAWYDENIYYDLSNDKWGVVEITPHGWKVISNPPIKFRRYGHQRAQVIPDPDGDVNDFLQFTNVREKDRVLALVHLVACVIPDIPHTILNTIGDHGSAKTMFGKLEKRLIDPSVLSVLSLPNTKNELTQQLSHHWMPVYDNLEKLQGWQSDCFCRACTGEGDSRRGLYTDEEDVFFNYKRCISLNGINNVATRPDLLDRLLSLRFERIPEDKRRTEEEIFQELEAAESGILGGIFNVLSKALEIKQTISLKRLPRMADWTLWGCAIAEAMDYGGAAFLDAYYSNIKEMNLEALRESIIGDCILKLMEGKARWKGSPTKLYEEFDLIADDLKIDKKSKGYPQAVNALSRMLNLIIPNLTDYGIKVIRDRDKSKREIIIINERVGDGEEPPAANGLVASHTVRVDKIPSSPSPDQSFDEIQQQESSQEGDGLQNQHRHQTVTKAKHCHPADGGDGDTVTETISSHIPSHKNQERVTRGDDDDDDDDVLHTSTCEKKCGRCGRELTGETFRGPAGLGSICTDCQQEIDRQHGFGADTQQPSGEELLPTFRNTISKLGHVHGLNEFTPVQLLMEVPKGLGCTVESVEVFLVDYAEDLQIRRTDSGKWQMTA